MKFLTYRSTPGLDRYSPNEQFGVWQEAHRELMRADYSYARQHQAYIATMTKASLLPALAGLPLAGGIVAMVLARFFHWPAAYGAWGTVVGVGLLLWSILRILWLANGQQHFMNGQVAALLQRRSAAA